MVQAEPLVSVVMATHNGSRFIGEAIESVLTQTYGNCELIIVDDGSRDKTREVVDMFGDSRIKAASNAKNLGLTRSLNLGIKKARGEYIARIDDDDIWPSRDKLERQVVYMRRHPETGICGTQNLVISESGQKLYRLKYPVTDARIRREMLSRNQFPHSSVLIRKTALDQVGVYDEKYRLAQDYELWLRLGLKWQLANLSDVYIKQRINIRGVTAKKNMKQFQAFLKIAWKYKDRYPGFWSNIPVYSREFALNILPKQIFYRLGGWRRS